MAKLDYKRMVKEIDELVNTDFGEHMSWKLMPHSNPYTQEETEQMATILGQVYMISHCIHCCKSCQKKYLLKK
jgi:hypothetical protein